MLKVYAAEWCPHCVRTIEFLKLKNIAFDYIDIEKQERPVVEKVVEVNGGLDWVVPTLEFNGRWREGRAFDASELTEDLKALGVEFS